MRPFLSILAVLVCVAAACTTAGYPYARSADARAASAHDELQAARYDSAPALAPETDQ